MKAIFNHFSRHHWLWNAHVLWLRSKCWFRPLTLSIPKWPGPLRKSRTVQGLKLEMWHHLVPGGWRSEDLREVGEKGRSRPSYLVPSRLWFSTPFYKLKDGGEWQGPEANEVIAQCLRSKCSINVFWRKNCLGISQKLTFASFLSLILSFHLSMKKGRGWCASP